MNTEHRDHNDLTNGVVSLEVLAASLSHINAPEERLSEATTAMSVALPLMEKTVDATIILPCSSTTIDHDAKDARELLSVCCNSVIAIVHATSKLEQQSRGTATNTAREASASGVCTATSSRTLDDNWRRYNVLCCRMVSIILCKATQRVPAFGTDCRSDETRRCLVMTARAVGRSLEKRMCSIPFELEDATAWGAYGDKELVRSVWTTWLPATLDAYHRTLVATSDAEGTCFITHDGMEDAAEVKNGFLADEELRLAIVLLDVARRFCLEIIEFFEEMEESSDDDTLSGDAAEDEKKASSVLAHDRLWTSMLQCLKPIEEVLRQRVVPAMRTQRRHRHTDGDVITPAVAGGSGVGGGISPRLTQGSFSTLPVNVIEGFMLMWRRLTNFLSSRKWHELVDVHLRGGSANEVHHDSDTSSTVLDTEHGEPRGVQRALDLLEVNHDEVATTEASRRTPLLPQKDSPSLLGDMSSRPKPLVDFMTKTNKGASSSFTHDEAQQLLSSCKYSYDQQIREMCSSVSALEVHNAMLAQRIVRIVARSCIISDVMDGLTLKDSEGAGDDMPQQPSCSSFRDWCGETLRDAFPWQRKSSAKLCSKSTDRPASVSAAIAHLHESTTIVEEENRRHTLADRLDTCTPSSREVASVIQSGILSGGFEGGHVHVVRGGRGKQNHHSRTGSSVASSHTATAEHTFQHDDALAQQEADADVMYKGASSLISSATPSFRLSSARRGAETVSSPAKCTTPAIQRNGLFRQGGESTAMASIFNTQDDMLLLVSPPSA